ncbi:hypothetical protein niasHT_022084 [Heterodera trifolii]|uniref:C2H2-type domain-containing protein n=1 Tax=Heterodera trifolii TaxID=157864 RepID=A0ABD2JES8_9BILA
MVAKIERNLKEVQLQLKEEIVKMQNRKRRYCELLESRNEAEILSIDLFEFRTFRNGSSEVACMECGKKFSPTEENEMGWHIVKAHDEYAVKLIKKQLEKIVK